MSYTANEVATILDTTPGNVRRACREYMQRQGQSVEHLARRIARLVWQELRGLMGTATPTVAMTGTEDAELAHRLDEQLDSFFEER